LEVVRDGAVMFSEETVLGGMRRKTEDLIDYLFREISFPQGCFLLTGTGIVPGREFTLHAGDLVRITIDPIGCLENVVG
jgi:2-dehydro-3-deoxy-D-arabinonate dehydratase